MPGTWQASININCCYLYCFWKKKPSNCITEKYWKCYNTKYDEHLHNVKCQRICFRPTYLLIFLLVPFVHGIHFLSCQCVFFSHSFMKAHDWSSCLSFVHLRSSLFLLVFLNDGLGGETLVAASEKTDVLPDCHSLIGQPSSLSGSF